MFRFFCLQYLSYICTSSLKFLSRKAEGNGPVKPWQPAPVQSGQGANSSHVNTVER